VKWSGNGITFTRSSSSDTISYSFNGSQLEYNGQPMPLLLPHAEVTDFTLDNINGNDDSKPYLFDFTITLTRNRSSATVQSTIMVKRPFGEEDDRDFIW
jgi:hypothetical protein